MKQWTLLVETPVGWKQVSTYDEWDPLIHEARKQLQNFAVRIVSGYEQFGYEKFECKTVEELNRLVQDQ